MKKNSIFTMLLMLGLFITNSCEKYELGNPLPSTVADFTETISNNSYAPCDVTFTNKSLNATSYHWDFGNGQTSNEENPTIHYETPGLYNVTLTCTAENDVHYNQLKKSKVINIKDITAGFTQVLYFTTRTTGYAGIYFVVLNDEAPLVQEFEPHDYMNRTYGIAVDSVNSKVYITDWSMECIYRYDADGKNPVRILDASVPGQEMVGDPQGIFIHDNKIYWGRTGGIYRANLDGTEPEEFIATGTVPIEYPLDMNFNRATGKIYLCNDKDAYSGGVFEVNIDGTGFTEVVPDVDVTAMDADFSNETLFLAGYASEGTLIEDYGIYSCKLDGSNLVKIGEYGLKATWGVTIDPKRDKLYWAFKNSNSSPDGKIVRSNFDGTGMEDVVNDTNPVAMSIGWVKL
ncbi:MAG: PKD domain-containing protein [Sphingobacteriia bacterium]|nr:PKD domain-containing protein [Sphingobacteriia bacterium]